jgi:hypothetical protein
MAAGSWRRRFFVIALAVLFVTGVVMRHAALRAAGRLLIVDEPISNADVIVVPPWAGDSGAIDAADLVHRGVAPRVAVLSAPPKPADQELARRGISYVDETGDLVHLLQALGVNVIDVIPNSVAGTEAEGEILPAWCDQQRFHSIVVISAPDHSRRVRRVMHRSLQGHATTVVIRSARYAEFDPDRWWETHGGLRVGIVELQKLLLDFARHPIS